MTYRILTNIGSHYQNEEGTQGVREVALKGLEERLQATYLDANEAKQFAQQKQVASNLPAVGAGRVKALVAFHTQQQNKQGDLDRKNAEVIRIRQWLHRQNAVVSPEGKIIWPLSRRKVVYDHELRAQNATKITIRNGLLYTSDNRLLDTREYVTHFSGPGYAIFVVSQEGHFHVSSHSVGHRHHSSLLGGAAVAGAGELKVQQGKIRWLSNKSGHYCPDIYQFLQTLHSLHVQGVLMDFPLKFMQVSAATQYACFDHFMKQNGFDDLTFETMQMLASYSHHLTPEFLIKNQLVWQDGAQGCFLGALYSTASGMHRFELSEMEALMKANNFSPRTIAKRPA